MITISKRMVSGAYAAIEIVFFGFKMKYESDYWLIMRVRHIISISAISDDLTEISQKDSAS